MNKKVFDVIPTEQKIIFSKLYPYMRFGLKLWSESTEMIYHIYGYEKDSFLTQPADDRMLTHSDMFHTAFDAMKPILRPMSDLLDTEQDFWIDLGEVLETMHPQHLAHALINKTTYALSPQKWMEVSDYLDSEFFDWRHDLIKEGKAVNINDLK